MAAITNYSTLVSAINDWSERSWSSDELNEFIALAESEFNLILRSYRRIETATLTTDSDGEATLPAGFRSMVSIVRDYAGAAPLLSVSWRSLAALNPYAEAGLPEFYAVQGSTLKVAPIAEDDFTITYETVLTGLSESNTTNWLLTIVPLAYLYMCLAMSEAKLQNPAGSAAYEARARATLEALGVQSDLAQYGNTSMVLDMPTP